MAAALVSRHHSHRELLVVVDPDESTVNVKLFAGRLEAEGDAPCSIRRPDNGGATVLAQVELREHAEGDDPARDEPLTTNLAVTWAWVPLTHGVTLDVAGTAFVFHPGQVRPEEFRARADHPFNRFAGPTPEPEPETPLLRPPARRSLPGLGRPRRLAPRWVIANRSSSPQPKTA